MLLYHSAVVLQSISKCSPIQASTRPTLTPSGVTGYAPPKVADAFNFASQIFSKSVSLFFFFFFALEQRPESSIELKTWILEQARLRQKANTNNILVTVFIIPDSTNAVASPLQILETQVHYKAFSSRNPPRDFHCNRQRNLPMILKIM